MKRKLSLLLALALVLTTIGCGTDTKEPSEPNSKVESEKESTTETENLKDNDETESEIKKKLKTIRVPAGEFYVDCATSLREKKEGYSSLLYDCNDALVGFTSKQSVKHEGTLLEAIEYFKSDFINDASTSSAGYLYGSSFEVVSSKNVTIANRDSVQFVGKVMNRDKWECHIYGYVFVIDGIPCAVIGLVSAQAQDATMIAQIDARVDEIASTLRTTE